VVSRGAISTRQDAIDHRSRQPPANSPPLGFVSEAGPCGDWLYRSLPPKGHGCWVVAPSLRPQQAGARGKTHRRDASKLARLRRAGDLPPGQGPRGEDDALQDLGCAREEALHALQAAQLRRTALRMRQAIR
jgi:transposase